MNAMSWEHETLMIKCVCVRGIDVNNKYHQNVFVKFYVYAYALEELQGIAKSEIRYQERDKWNAEFDSYTYVMIYEETFNALFRNKKFATNYFVKPKI